MSISHAPPDLPKTDIPDTRGREGAPSAAPALEPVVPISTRRTRVPRWLRRASGPLLLLALWQLLSVTGVLTPDVLASPGRIAQVSGDLIADGSLPSAMGTSLRRVALGLVFGTAVGTDSPWCRGCSGSARTSWTPVCRCCAPCRSWV